LPGNTPDNSARRLAVKKRIKEAITKRSSFKKPEPGREMAPIPAALQAFAQKRRLRIKRDDCGEPVIPGKRGDSHLWFDDKKLCLIVVDGRPAKKSRWMALGGKLWMGDISPLPNGKRVQDVKITGIPPARAKEAIAMIRARPKRMVSEAERARLQQLAARLPQARRHPKGE
jgi:hypothetical protein